MAVAKVDVCNLALMHLAVGLQIQNFDTEASEGAAACRLSYDIARQKVLRDFDWPFAFAVANLAQVAIQPTTEWGYSYRYPANAVAIRRLVNGATRVDTEDSRAIYAIGRDATGQIIYSDLASSGTNPLVVQYTYDEQDTTRFAPDFVVALAFYLAFLIGPRVAGGDQFKLADRAYQLYQRAIIEAQVNAAKEAPPDFTPDPSLVNIR